MDSLQLVRLHLFILLWDSPLSMAGNIAILCASCPSFVSVAVNKSDNRPQDFVALDCAWTIIVGCGDDTKITIKDAGPRGPHVSKKVTVMTANCCYVHTRTRMLCGVILC